MSEKVFDVDLSEERPAENCRKSKEQKAIYTLAEQNAKSVVKALVNPILSQLNEEQSEIKYELNVVVEE